MQRFIELKDLPRLITVIQRHMEYSSLEKPTKIFIHGGYYAVMYENGIYYHYLLENGTWF